ncbi:MAG: tRNA uracil 4-sulfurtransferase ThiI [Bdellovibrionota bacterium]
MNDRAILLRYNEIALKGENRRWFEDRLMINVRRLLERALGREEKIVVTRNHGRVIVEAPWNEATSAALQRVFGISSYSPMRTVPTDMAALQRAALEEFRTHVELHGMPKTFRVFTKRSDKAIPMDSMAIDREIGSFIKDAHPALTVALKGAELAVGVEIRFDRSYIWTEKVAGPGGLPVGSNAPLLALLSGGLDSPVAAIQTLRRGAGVSYLHFHGAPFVGPEVLEKVEDLARIVNRFHPDPQPLHVIPFGKIQEKIALATTAKFRTILYRRMMIRIAERVARKVDAQALITGESLGQVASQTVENLTTINQVATMPILRPLITYDKDEIIAKAHAWETFETAIRPGVDCCTLFSDRHPAIRASLETILEQEKLFPVDAYVEEAMAGLEVRRT